MAVYFFYGEEDFNIELELKKMRSKLSPDFLSLSFRVLSNPDFDTLINALRAAPMMFGNMLTIINAEGYFLEEKGDGAVKFQDSELAEIEEALKNVQNTSDIVFAVRLPRGENKKLDARRKLYKILSKFNAREFPMFKTYQTDEILGWIKKCAKSKGLEIEDEAAQLLSDQIGNNLREFDIELDKLKLAVYPKMTITKEAAADICISHQDLFNFTELVMKGEKDKALLEFKKLLDKKHPLELLSAIQTIIRKWIILKTKSSLSNAELAKIIGQSEYVVRQTREKLKNTKLAGLVKLKQNLFEIEYKVKSGEVIDIISEAACAVIG